MDDALFVSLKDHILEKYPQENLEVFLLSRLIQENRIRKLKRMGQSCPFERESCCGRLDIRCGERQQFASPEAEQDRQRPHQCNYRADPGIAHWGVLVVEDEPNIRELFRQYFIKSGASPKLVDTADNMPKAVELLRQARIENRTYHVILSDIRLGEGSGFDLVGYLVERNYNSRILLVSGYYRPQDLPHNYVGDHEIVPGRKVVSAFAGKPITMKNFDALIGRVQREFKPV